MYKTIECFFVGVEAKRGFYADACSHPVALTNPGCWVRKSLLMVTVNLLQYIHCKVAHSWKGALLFNLNSVKKNNISF